MSRRRPAPPPVAVSDQSGAPDRSLFSHGRHGEPFTARHRGWLAEPRHTSVPRLGTTGPADPQARPPCLAQASGSVTARRAQRLDLWRPAWGETPCTR